MSLFKPKILYIGFFLTLLFVGTPLVFGQDGSSQIAAPRIIDTIPLVGEELPLDRAVNFTFDRPMDAENTDNSYTVEPDTDGTWEWSDNARHLTFTPDQDFERDTEYRFTIMAVDADGQPMDEEYSLRLISVGYVEVVDMLPAPDSTRIETDSTITVIFNRPIVPLTSITQQADLPNPLTITPETVGVGEWLNTSIFIFTPEESLVGGSQYSVTVNSGLEGVNGAILAEDVTYRFSTDVPEVLSMQPRDGENGVALDPTITVNFTQPMDSATQNGIRVEGPNGSLPELSYEWSENSREVTITPTNLLELSSLYDVIVDSDIVRSISGAELDFDYRQSFETVPYPRIMSTEPSDGDNAARTYGGFRIYFNAPIDQETLEGKVTIEPEPWREYETYYYTYDTSHALFFDIEPSTTYTVTIAPGIADPYGNEITDTTVVTFTSRAYDPEVTLNTPGFVGLYNAYNPSTRLFVTHRNISNLDLNLYRLDIDTLAYLTGPNNYQRQRDFDPERSDLIRSWRTPVEAQLNHRRYELMLLSEVGASGVENLQCLGAPYPRLSVGGTGQVSEEDPRPSRVRSEPNLGGEILTEFEPGTTFDVLEGPVCSDGYFWWKIYDSESGIEGWTAEGDSVLYYIEPTSAPSVDDEELPPLEPGVYFLTVNSPETRAEGWDDRRHMLIVATTNITFKYTPNQALAWVTDMQSGLPLSGVPVTFYDRNMNEIDTVVTDPDGLASLSIDRLTSLYTTLYAVVETDDHFGFVVSDFSSGLDPWRFEMPSNYESDRMNVYLYTDRPIYRPDQPVYFKGIVRDQDDITYTPIRGLRWFPVQVLDSEQQVIYETDVTLTPYGTFSGEFELDEGAALGYYRIVATIPVNNEDRTRDFSIGFNVAEYRAPEFQVTVTPAVDEVAQGETIQVDVESRYFFGGAVSNADVTWNVIGTNHYFNYDGPGRWQFIDYNYDDGPSSYYDTGSASIANGEAVTDDQGRFMIEIPADLGDKTQSQRYTIEAVITDESDQAVAGRTLVVIHQGNVYIGLSPDQYVSTAGQETGFQVLSVDWESEPVAGQIVDYRIVERRWSSVQEKDPAGRTTWVWDVEEIEVDSGTVITDADGLGHVAFTPPTAGAYKIYAVTEDAEENTVNSSAFMWVSGREYVSWRQQNSNRIDLITDSDDYEIGDTAEILIASPFQGETVALITIERGDLMKTEVIRMETNSYVYQLPIEENYAPNIFVSVILVKGVDENNPYAQFRMGMAQLNVETDRLAIDVEVTPDLPEGATAGPGDTVTLNISTTNWEGEPVSAEVGVGVTDLAVLSIAPPNSGTLMSHYYGQQGVSVRTASALTISVDQLTQTIIDTVKGGGGGGADQGIFDVRQEFVDTPLWEPDVVTDENGEGQITITLPDNLTTWRIDARAVTSGLDGPMLVGQDTTDFISTKPVLIRPVTPRFMVVGDELNLGAIVNNNTSEDQLVDIVIEGTGFTTVDDAELTQTVTIPAGGRMRVDWKVRVLDVPFIDVFFGVQTQDGVYQDASKPLVGQGDEQLLPVYKYVVPETVGTSGTLEGPEAVNFTEVIALPERIDAEQGSLDIRIDRSLAGPALDGLSYLRNYPHQCIEQTISRFLPNVMTIRALRSLNQSNPELEAILATQVNFGLQRLYAQQKVDGGWGWFPSDDSNPLTTAYALIGLVEARNSEFTVEDNVIQDAIGFLNEYLLETDRNITTTSDSWILNRRAFVLYALARSGNGNASRLTTVYDLRERLNLDAEAYLMMAMKLVNPDDPRLETIMSDFANAAVLSATGTHWEDRADYRNWTTNTRTTALILMAMAQHNSSNDLLPGAVRWMMVARQADAWETTQETAWAVMALTDWMVYTGELEADYNFALRLNDETLEVEDDTANATNVKEHEVLSVEVSKLLLDEANRLSLIKSDGQGNMYYTAHLTTFQHVPSVEPASRGIIINREYHLASDPEGEMVTSAHVGDEIIVTLTIIAPRNLHYVVVEDPIPAGAEAVNPNLLTTSIIGERPNLSRTDPLSRGWGWWWFSRTEFRDEKVVMYSTYLPRGTYTYTYRLRLGLAGEYNVIPTTGQEFYFPEVYGRGSGMLFVIEPTVAEVAAEE